MFESLKKSWEQYRLNRAVESLNESAAFFGFGPLTEEEWRLGLTRLGVAARSCGVTAEEAARGMNAIAVAQGLKD